MLLEGVPRAAVRVVRSAGYWVGSVVGGISQGHGPSLGVLAFGVFECRTIFFYHLLYIGMYTTSRHWATEADRRFARFSRREIHLLIVQLELPSYINDQGRQWN
jgi:hypothetical protein